MIKINLLGDQETTDNAVKLQLAAFGASLAVLIAVCFSVSYWFSGRLEELNSTADRLAVELKKKQQITNEVKEFEAKKADYNKKLLIIATLKKSKTGPVRVMDDLNNAVPERAWITEVRETDGNFQISGKALDAQTISTFMRDLDKSEYFGEPGKEIIKLADMDGVKLREFSFDVAVLYAGELAQTVQEQPAEEPTRRRSSLDGAPDALVFNRIRSILTR